MPQTQSADSKPRSESPSSSSQDIVGRLRTATGLDLDLKREAADEITHLRAEKASDWRAACESARAASAEIARLRLTDAEREAVAWAAGWLSGGRADPPAGGKDALWSLLERLG